MRKEDFAITLETHFAKLGDAILAALKPDEDINLTLDAEDTLYLRLNANRIRQNTNVEQILLNLQLQSNGRTLSKARSISGSFEADRDAMIQLLEQSREELQALPPDPFQVPMANHGQSRDHFRAKITPTNDLIDSICNTAEGTDLAGLYCGGSVVRANRNSKGQSHWFASDSFFMDYSLYNGKKAAKGLYSEALWSADRWKTSHQHTKHQLDLLSKPAQIVKPGRYRTYLAPGAVAEVLSMLSWGALSASYWKQGQSPFNQLASGEKTLSPMFSLRENFALGLAPRFNSIGEVSADKVPLIENGRFRQFLTSSRTAKEYGLEGNAASERESLRSPELLNGLLEEKDILKELGTGLYLSNLHYLNWSDTVSARVTGMTRYACFWVENGEVVGPIKDLRFDVSMFDILGSKLAAVTKSTEIEPVTDTYGARGIGGKKMPGLLIEDFTYTL